jgi:hypothetical protein
MEVEDDFKSSPVKSTTRGGSCRAKHHDEKFDAATNFKIREFLPWK